MKITKHIGTMAAEVGEGAEKLKVDRITIASLVVNPVTGIAQIGLAFGATDSAGQFHLDMKRAAEVANITITREANTDTFNKLFCDEHGELKKELQDFCAPLLKDVLLPHAHRQIWGGKYPDMEVSQSGEVIFTTAKPEEKK